MNYLTVESLKTHIYAGVIDKISHKDDTILHNAIEAAIIEAQGYLSRYDITYLFYNPDPGYKKDPILFMNVKTLAKWHFINLSNPNIDYDDAEKRYGQSIKWLLNIQSGKIVPPGWKLSKEEHHDTFFHYSSNPKRRQHY